MIWADYDYRAWASNGGVNPFDPAKVNPASIDLCLGGQFVRLSSGQRFIQKDYELVPGEAVLVSTREFITMPDDCAGAVYLKSSRMREGLDMARAGWIDPGFRGEITLLLYTHAPIMLTMGMKFVQLVMERLDQRPGLTYQDTGRYNDQRGPTKSR
jgi:dCTP deaminase